MKSLGQSEVAVRLPVQQECACVVGGIIDLIGKKWTLCIVVTLGNRPHIRFNDLLAALGSISPRTLSDTLKALEQEGLVRREAFAQIPPRVEYQLTPQGLRLLEAVRPLMMFSASLPGSVCQPSRTASPSA